MIGMAVLITVLLQCGNQPLDCKEPVSDKQCRLNRGVFSTQTQMGATTLNLAVVRNKKAMPPSCCCSRLGHP